MQEFINALKIPFTSIRVEEQPRPAVIAATWVAVTLVGIGLLK